MIYAILCLLIVVLFYSFVNSEYTELKEKLEFQTKKTTLLEQKVEDLLDEIKVIRLTEKSKSVKDLEGSKLSIL